MGLLVPYIVTGIIGAYVAIFSIAFCAAFCCQLLFSNQHKCCRRNKEIMVKSHGYGIIN